MLIPSFPPLGCMLYSVDLRKPCWNVTPPIFWRKPHGWQNQSSPSACAEAQVFESHPRQLGAPAFGTHCKLTTCHWTDLAWKGVSAINSTHLLAPNNLCCLCSVWGKPWVSRTVERKQNRAGHVAHLVERLPNVYKVRHSVFSIAQIRRGGPQKPEGQKFVILNGVVNEVSTEHTLPSKKKK